MSLNPSDIESHRFREAFRGYDKDDVDEFLDRVADRINELLVERQRLEERITTIEADAAESVEAERLLKRTLITAQRTADETVAEAREEADRMRAEAQEYATELRDDAEQRAAAAMEDASARAMATTEDAEQRAAARLAEAAERAAAIVDDAQREAAQDRTSAREQLDRARQAIADLERYRGEYRDRVRIVITEQLEALDRIGELPDVPEQLTSIRAEAEETIAELDAAAPPPEPEAPSDAGGDAEEPLSTMPGRTEPPVALPGEDADNPDAARLFAEDLPDDAEDTQPRAPRAMVGRRAGRRRDRNEERA